MSTPLSVPVSECVATSYRPDCDYLDGELLERNIGEWHHSRWQMLLEPLSLQSPPLAAKTRAIQGHEFGLKLEGVQREQFLSGRCDTGYA